MAPRACQKTELGAGFPLAPRSSPNVGQEANLARDLAAIRRMRDVENEAFCGAGHLIHRLVFADSRPGTKTGKPARSLRAAAEHLDDGYPARPFQVMVRRRGAKLAAGQL